MVNYLFLIILHLLGDFYLQTTKIAQCKNAKKGSACGACRKCKDTAWINKRYLLIHSILYIVPFLTLYLVMNDIYATVIIAILTVSHILIDAAACYFNKKNKQTAVYIVDQLFHVGIICTIPQFVTFNYNMESCYAVLKVVFICLLLIMPCSIMINKLFKDIYPESDEMGLYDIGSIIGVMERFLTFIFACFESFPAIAIIITVKTWARTNDLKETEFRNKYLLGTLTSLVLALTAFVIYKAM